MKGKRSLVEQLRERDEATKDGRASGHQPDANGGAKARPKRRESPKQATILVALAAGAELFHDAAGEGYATVTVESHRETHRLRSRAFRRWLCGRFYAAHKRAPSAQALQDALGVLEARASFDAPEFSVAVRLAAHGDSILLHLADSEWRSVEATAAGWRIVTKAPVKFIRPRGLLPLPLPVAGGTVAELGRFINVGSEDDWRLAIAWLLAAMRPRGPYPVLVLNGEQGSAKSTTARVLRSLIDPNLSPLRSEPREPRDLAISASNSWLVAFDNLSYLPAWLSDALCRMATGGGFATRGLYTDDEEVIFDAQRPVILTGIEELATRSDLLDRAIVLHLPPLPEERCRPEAELCAEFEKARPRILGALLDVMAGALHESPSVKLPRHPRMADFALWATAAELALGWERGSFLKAYTGNRAEANDLALDASPIAGMLRELAELGGWEGTCGDLLAKLAEEGGDKATRSQSWPKTPRALSGQLRRLAPNLRRAGVNVETRREPGGQRRRIVRVTRQNGDTSDRPYRPDRPMLANLPNPTGDGSGTVQGDSGRSPVNDRPDKNPGECRAGDDRDGRDGPPRDFSNDGGAKWMDGPYREGY
jgi:hypothetical protein